MYISHLGLCDYKDFSNKYDNEYNYYWETK